MDKPGLQRALPYMLVVFVLSLVLVYAVRSLQNMDPVWANDTTTEGAQVGLVLAAFASMGAFLWGIGAFDPKMSEHGDHAEEHEVEEAPEKEFQLKTDGWLYYMGYVQYQTALSLLDAQPLYPAFQLPHNTNVVSLAIGYLLWIPLFIALTLTAVIAQVVVEIKNVKYRWFNTGNFILNWIINVPLLFLVWIPGALITRLILGLLAGLWLTLGVPVMAISWALQIVRFYFGQFLIATILSVLIVVVLFAFALLPHGFRLQTVKLTDTNADVSANGFGEFVIPIQDILGLVLPPEDFANQPIEGTSQFAVFLGFIIIIFVSLALAGGLIALFFYIAHQGVKEVQEVPRTDEDLTPPHIVREVGKFAGIVNRVIYAIPNAIGYKK